MTKLKFDSPLTDEQIAENFKNISFFDGLMNGLTEALAYEKGTAKAAGTSDNIIEAWDFADNIDDPEKVKKLFSENPPNIYGFGHTPLYADVIDSIQTGRAPYVDGEAGKRALELVLAIYKSAAEHRPVKLPLENCSTMDFMGRFGDGNLHD